MKTIIGIDPGLASTGYGIIRAGMNRYVHIIHGSITTPSGEPLAIRLLTIFNRISELIQEFKPDEGGVESLYFAKNVKSALPVAHARGAVLTALAKEGVPLKEYSPLEIKQAVVGRGKAEKQQVQQMMKVLLGLKEVPSPDHAADALAAAFCHSTRSGIDSFYKKG